MIILNCVGNDIVDLGDPEARGKSLDARFIKRTMTPDEQWAMHRFANPDRLLWAFWAAKETAYKALNKRYPSVSSAPGRYGVVLSFHEDSADIIHPVSGVVHTPEGLVPVRVIFQPDYVHCIGGHCGSGSLDGMEWGVGTIDAAPESGGKKSVSERESFTARLIAASKMADILHCDPQDIHISKKSGWPKVYVKGKPADMDISLSHDGRLAAFAVAGLRDCNHFINYDLKT
jgi:phosphopantetheinyl transferase (holo-ACP synthase)